MSVLCIIGDVVDSRRIENRREFQRRLQRCMEQVNQRARHLISPYTLTLGDEFQAVYDGAEGLFGDLICIQERTFPQRVRFSIGVGALSTPVNRQRAIGMDGPAFHASREGIKILKNSTAYFGVNQVGEKGTSWVNPTLELISHETSNWKQSRFQILRGLLDGVEPKSIARSVRLTPAAVYKSIQAGALNTLVILCREITRTLDLALTQG